MKLRSMFLTMAICAMPWIANAQPIQGIYVGAGAGANIPLATKNTPAAAGFHGQFDLDQKLGYDGRLSLGYALGNGWRFEAEGTLGQSDVKGVTGAAFITTGSGTVRNLGVMANALFDLDVGSPYVFPYLGLGMGYQSTRLSFVATRSSPTASLTASGSAGGAAGQIIGGFSFPIPNMPGLSVTADYRVMDILGGEKFSGTSSTGAPDSTTFRNQFVQSVIVGIRYAFNTPPPAGLTQPAPPARPQVQSYQVFFALNDASLDRRAEAVVREVARAATQGQKARIEVAGASGTEPYSQALADRRAAAVTAALVADGVPMGRASGDQLVTIGPDAGNHRMEVVSR
jgi:OOP family OmpA-OmpF porin